MSGGKITGQDVAFMANLVANRHHRNADVGTKNGVALMYGGFPALVMAGPVAAYFDLDGTLLDASSEKTLAAELAKRRPWRIPVGTVSWTLGFIGNLMRGR